MNRKVPARIRKLMKELKEGLIKIYGDQLKAVYLYGSYARGEEGSDSDVDVMIVLNNYESYGREIDRTGELTSSLSLEYGVSISRVIMKESSVENQRHSIASQHSHGRHPRMNEYSRKLLNKAVDAIEAAELLVDNGKSDIAAGRAYYAMFYVAEALLNEKGLRFNKHSAVHAAFGEHFAKTNEMDVKFHRWLLNAFDKRLAGDYGVDTDIEKDITVDMIHQAHEFLEAAQEYLKKPKT